MNRLVLFAASVLLISSPAAAAGLVNGSFELPGGGGTHFLSPGSTFITGWTTVDATPGGDSDVSISDDASFGAVGVHPSDGNYFVDLTGDVGRGKGLVSDSVAVVAGAAYQLSFDVGAFWVAGYGSFGDATVDLLVNGVLAGSFTNTQSLSAPGSDWQRFTYDFTATGSTVSFTLLSSTLTSSSNLGVGLDNVVLSDGAGVPEPTTWSILVAGFGLAGAALRRRNRVFR